MAEDGGRGWRLRGLRRGLEIGICLVYMEEEELWLVLECEGTNEWREMVLKEIIWNLDPIIGTPRLQRGRNTENWHILGVLANSIKNGSEYFARWNVYQIRGNEGGNKPRFK
jgi:hypothetical protein